MPVSGSFGVWYNSGVMGNQEPKPEEKGEFVTGWFDSEEPVVIYWSLKSQDEIALDRWHRHYPPKVHDG